MLTIVPVAAGAYVATNLDNLTLFVVLLTTYPDRRKTVVAGYFVSAFLLGFAGFLIGGAAGNAPVEYLGFLGIVPIAIGAIGVGRLIRGAGGANDVEHRQVSHGRTAFRATVLSQLGNGADTIVTFAALFADSMTSADSLIILTLLAMAIMFALTGAYAVRHPALVTVINRHAHRITPFILIVVGGYILANTASDLLAG